MLCVARSIALVLLVGSAAFSLGPGGLAQAQPQNLASTVQVTFPDAPAPHTLAASGVNVDLGGSSAPTAVAQRESDQDASHPAPPGASSASLGGTATNVHGDIVPGATVVLEGPRPQDRRSALASDSGAFQFDRLKPGTPYRITIAAEGLETWKSESMVLAEGQYLFLPAVSLKIPEVVTSVTVYATPNQIATEQVQVAEKQRVFGIIPNFYVTYDRNPVPLTTGLKFKLALKADTDPVTYIGVAFMAAIYQAGDLPDYGQGMQGYAKRMAAGYADTTSDIFVGGAILPSLLHQDPRYFYQGTGSKKSRAFHAISSPFVCRGDNGRSQPNYSSMGGDLASGAISNLYYPESNRGLGLVFEGFLITTGARTVNALVQEFVLRRFTPSARANY